MTASPLWTLACAGLVPPLFAAVALAMRGTIAERVVGAQLATSVATFLIVLLTYAIDQPSSIDLALAMALLGLPGSLLIAVFVERWL